MKVLSLVTVVLLCLAEPLLQRAQAATVVTVQETGPRSNRINIVFLSEGYTAAELPNFATHVNDAVNFLFDREPWKQYRSYCNIYRIEVASTQSGCDNGNTSGPGVLRNTYFGAGFTTPSVTQLLTLDSTGYSRAYDLLNQLVPEYELPVVLVNDTKYGGSGGSISVASRNGDGIAVVEHEIGHSFANLADEYDTEYLIYTPEEMPNTTAQTVRALIRWNYWIDASTPVPTPETASYDALAGLFEGSMYRTTGWYRPHNNSLMRSLNRPCGQVNGEQFVLQFYNQVSPVDGFAPATSPRAVTTPQQPLSFQVTPMVPSSGIALQLTWRIDGAVQSGQTGPRLDLLSDSLGNGAHTVAVTVRDPTAFVRKDPDTRLSSTVTWPLTLSGQLPSTLAAWRATYGADAAVNSSDGLTNLIKYSVGRDANTPTPPDQLPSVALADANGQRYLTLTVPRRMRRTDVSYIIEVSADLQVWYSGVGHTVLIEDTDTRLVVRDAQPSTGPQRRFIRLRVSALP
jgi:hypothetical protein